MKGRVSLQFFSFHMPKLSRTTQASSMYTSESGSGSKMQLLVVVLSVVVLFIVVFSVPEPVVVKRVVNVVGIGVVLYVVVLGVYHVYS